MRITHLSVTGVATMFAIAGAMAAAAVALSMPDRFEANGVLRPGTPSISPALTQRVLSRETLSALINEHDLYSSERATQSLDKVVDRMRRDIRISALPDNGSFSVSFRYPDRHKSQKVTEDLLRRFIEENIHQTPPANLEVVAPPYVPQRPVEPNRVAFAGSGLAIGAAVGTIIGLIRRRANDAV